MSNSWPPIPPALADDFVERSPTCWSTLADPPLELWKDFDALARPCADHVTVVRKQWTVYDLAYRGLRLVLAYNDAAAAARDFALLHARWSDIARRFDPPGALPHVVADFPHVDGVEIANGVRATRFHRWHKLDLDQLLDCICGRAPAPTRIPRPALDASDEDWTVYTDALLEIGDPRGELIAHRTIPPGWFGKTTTYDLEIRRDTIVGADVDLLDEASRFDDLERYGHDLERLDLRSSRDLVGDITSTFDNLALRFPKLRRFSFCHDSAHTLEFSLAALWPQLTDVMFDVSEFIVGPIGPIRAPNLRTLEITGAIHAYGPGDIVEVFGTAELPKLERFAITHMQIDWRPDIAPILRNLARCPLAHLSLRGIPMRLIERGLREGALPMTLREFVVDDPAAIADVLVERYPWVRATSRPLLG